MVAHLLLLQACAAERFTEVVVSSVSVLPGNAAVATGATVRFEATVSDEEGAPLTGVAVAWSSTAPGVVSVDPTGVAQALSGGVATVEASFHGVVGVATVVVLRPAGFSVEETNGSTSVRESGTSDSLTLMLDAEPSTQVRLAVRSEDPGEATVSPSAIVFTPSNWSRPRTVVVTGTDDITVDGDQTAIVVVSADAGSGSEYDAVADHHVSVTVLDDDVADFTLTESKGRTSAREGGRPDTISVALAAQPLGPVVLLVSSDDPTDATVSPGRLTFTPLDWNRRQPVTFTAVDDHVRDGTRSRTVTFAVHDPSSDPAFHGLIKRVTATTRDEKDRPHQETASSDPHSQPWITWNGTPGLSKPSREPGERDVRVAGNDAPGTRSPVRTPCLNARSARLAPAGHAGTASCPSGSPLSNARSPHDQGAIHEEVTPQERDP